MISIVRFYAFLTVLLFYSYSAQAQNAAIGFWDSHLPYNTAIGMVTDGNTLYTICNEALFAYNPVTDEAPVPYSKVDGMSSIGMQCAAYDRTTQTLVLAYADGNIDLFKDNTFYNIPYLKLKTFLEVKKINHIYTYNGIAYLSTTVGLIIVDIANYRIRETYQFTEPGTNKNAFIYSFIAAGNYFYTATEIGVFRIEQTSPQMQNPLAWQKIDSFNNIINIASANNALYFSSADAVFRLAGDSLRSVYHSKITLSHIDGGNNCLFISEHLDSTRSTTVLTLSPEDNITSGITFTGNCRQVVQLPDNSIWIADSINGLRNRNAINDIGRYAPPGPSSTATYDLYAHNKNLYIAHGGYNGLFFANSNPNGFSEFSNNKWILYKSNGRAPLNSTTDYSSIVKEESTGTLYAGSFLSGLLIINKDGSSSSVNSGSIFDGSIAYGSSYHQVISLALDNADNLWVSQVFSKHQLYVKTKAGEWAKFAVPGLGYGGGGLTLDDSGQVWIGSTTGVGAIVYNPGKNITDSSDDASYILSAGRGNGNLPSNNVLSIAKDKRNNMWIGTSNGIAVMKNCIATNTHTTVCEAEIPYVTSGLNAGDLFVGKNVTSIAVDAADRKWVGTNDGLWLISPTGDQVLEHFGVDNSPLPSNSIQKIYIDKTTGDVYAATSMGVVSYHGAVAEGADNTVPVVIFPNPVAADYKGAIAIKGVKANADVKIADITGQLVYHTRAQGGQVIWNGTDYTGRRPQTGVYLVFVSDADGKQVYTGKLFFLQ